MPNLPRVATVVLNQGTPAKTENLDGSAFNTILQNNKGHLLSVLPAVNLLILSANDRYLLIL